MNAHRDVYDLRAALKKNQSSANSPQKQHHSGAGMALVADRPRTYLVPPVPRCTFLSPGRAASLLGPAEPCEPTDDLDSAAAATAAALLGVAIPVPRDRTTPVSFAIPSPQNLPRCLPTRSLGGCASWRDGFSATETLAPAVEQRSSSEQRRKIKQAAPQALVPRFWKIGVG